MSVIEALILGVVQGLTEFIPVSSSGHLLLVHELFGTAEGSLAFDVALHVGTLLALIVYFRRDIVQLLSNVARKSKEGKLARLIILATVPAAVAGLLLGDFIDETLRSSMVVVVTLVLVGIAMLLVEKYGTKKQTDVSARTGLTVGLAQAVALIPGVSRSGITISAGMASGLTREAAARFSFLLAMPIIAGSAIGSLIKDPAVFQDAGAALWVGITAAFVSGLGAITFLMNFLSKRSLAVFAWYRFGLAFVVLVVTLAT